MATKNPLGQIRKNLECYVGKEIRLRANRGRRKTLEKVGVLESTYPAIFVVRIEEESYNQRLSFSYADVLTETVQLSFVGSDDKEQALSVAK